jgi:L-alanine-DL-glutamate epimerase-like enolase superfamily enzyme
VGKDIDKEIAVLGAVRDVSAEINLSVDANQGWGTVSNAIDKIGKLDRFNLDWIEQPIDMHDIKGNESIRKATGAKIMLDESVQSFNDCEHAIEHNAADLINIKLAKTGGTTNAKKIISLCESNGVDFILGSMVDSVVADAVAIHLAACYDFKACEVCGVYLIKKDIAEGLIFEKGRVTVPDSPGLGIKMLYP